jgi:hypothetical protein
VDLDPDPVGPKTCGSGGSGSESGTLLTINHFFLFELWFSELKKWLILVIFMYELLASFYEIADGIYQKNKYHSSRA